MEPSKQHSKRTNKTLSITDDQFESEVNNEDKYMYDIYTAYCKALRVGKFKRVDVINFWLTEQKEENHELSEKKNDFKSNRIK